jgi:cell division protein FtsL
MVQARKSVSERDAKQAENRSSRSRNRKVRPVKPFRTGLCLVLMALFFMEALLYAWSRVQCVDAGYGLNRETHRRQALLKERNTLNIELARLKSPERIETIAKTRLGLNMPDAQQTVSLP